MRGRTEMPHGQSIAHFLPLNSADPPQSHPILPQRSCFPFRNETPFRHLIPTARDLILSVSYYVNELGLAVEVNVIVRRPMAFEASVRCARPVVEFADGMPKTIVFPSQVGQLRLRTTVLNHLLLLPA